MLTGTSTGKAALLLPAAYRACKLGLSWQFVDIGQCSSVVFSSVEEDTLGAFLVSLDIFRHSIVKFVHREPCNGNASLQ